VGGNPKVDQRERELTRRQQRERERVKAPEMNEATAVIREYGGTVPHPDSSSLIKESGPLQVSRAPFACMMPIPGGGYSLIDGWIALYADGGVEVESVDVGTKGMLWAIQSQFKTAHVRHMGQLMNPRRARVASGTHD
jgi:hypothetical protein